MNLYDLIRRKRDRGRLSGDEIRSLVNDFTAGRVPDYQMAAWLMAVWLRGMSADETANLTAAMMHSGDVFDLSDVAGPKVDKHSTGGVGDKVSLILAPLAAACGVVVPMVSGRSLGHTGGTLDKLEVIPGFRTNLRFVEFRRCLDSAGLAIMGQTDRMCPADRRMYALRDVTATVDSIPLIAASIMSKKMAEGIDALVLDVKTGSGAFMSKPAQARRLARTMIAIGTDLGKRVTAVITGMWQPLGRTVGNAVEVVEAIEALKGNWADDVADVTLALGEEMLLLGGRARSQQQARRMLLRALSSGRALERFRAMVKAQGGNPAVIEDYGILPQPKHRADVIAAGTGFVRSIDALAVGRLGVGLGIGRASLDSVVDPTAGFTFHRKVGDRAVRGETLAEVSGADSARVTAAAAALAKIVQLGPAAPRQADLVLSRLSRP
jgi:pyrimidine-nucleoside phosphorylase